MKSTMAERVHLFTTPNSLHATPNLFQPTNQFIQIQGHYIWSG